MNTHFAAVFPGQGSQSVSMLAKLNHAYPTVSAIYADAAEVLGYDLWEIVQAGPEEKLNLTIYTQPALLAAGFAVWQVFSPHFPTLPRFLAGHSLGEYTALVCAQAISFADGLRLVAKRAALMQNAVPEGQGAMAVLVGLDADAVAALCTQAQIKGSVAPANFNSPGQIVVAGVSGAIDHVVQLAKHAGAKIAKRLPISVPSHCELMKEAAQEFSQYLTQIPINTPKIPIIHNRDVKVHQHPDEIRQALVEQLYSPVRWVDTIQFMIAEGIETIIECGPNKVLTGLNKRIDPKINASCIADPEDMELFTKEMS